MFSSNDIFFLERKVFALLCDNAKRQVIPERETKSEINIGKKLLPGAAERGVRIENELYSKINYILLRAE